MSRPISFAVDATGQWSGGGRVWLENAHFAAERHNLLRGGPDAVPVVPRNVPARRGLRGPFVLAPQNAWPWHPGLGPTTGTRERATLLALRAASEWYLRRAVAVLRISSSIPAHGRHSSPVLHNVLDESFDAALEATVPAPPGAAGAVVSVGSANSYRGFVTLVQAHERYRRSGGDRPLFIAGPPSNRAYVRRVEELVEGRRDVTLLWRPLARSECLAACRGAATVVLPSVVEASPLSLLEALACSPRVLCSDIPGHREIADGRLHPDAYVTAGDPEALAAGLRAGTPSPDGHAMLAAVSYRAAARDAWAESLAGWLSVLAAQLGDGAPAGVAGPWGRGGG